MSGPYSTDPTLEKETKQLCLPDRRKFVPVRWRCNRRDHWDKFPISCPQGRCCLGYVGQQFRPPGRGKWSREVIPALARRSLTTRAAHRSTLWACAHTLVTSQSRAPANPTGLPRRQTTAPPSSTHFFSTGGREGSKSNCSHIAKSWQQLPAIFKIAYNPTVRTSMHRFGRLYSQSPPTSEFHAKSWPHEILNLNRGPHHYNSLSRSTALDLHHAPTNTLLAITCY